MMYFLKGKTMVTLFRTKFSALVMHVVLLSTVFSATTVVAAGGSSRASAVHSTQAPSRVKLYMTALLLFFCSQAGVAGDPMVCKNVCPHGVLELNPQCPKLFEPSFQCRQFFSGKEGAVFQESCPELHAMTQDIAKKVGVDPRTVTFVPGKKFGFEVTTSHGAVQIFAKASDLYRSVRALAGVFAHELCHVVHGDVTDAYTESYEKHFMEFAADACSAEAVGADGMIASLSLSRRDRDEESESHPSINSRLRKLMEILTGQREACRCADKDEEADL